jgi:hypothetical protein
MYRFQELCGEKLFSRKTASQLREVAMKVTMLNKLPSLGRPVFSVAYNSPHFRTGEILIFIAFAQQRPFNNQNKRVVVTPSSQLFLFQGRRGEWA